MHSLSSALPINLHTSPGPDPVHLTPQHQLHRHQLLRHLPRPVHVSRIQRRISRHRGRTHRRRGQRHEGPTEDEGGHAVVPQHPQAGLPRRRRRPADQHEAARPRPRRR
ncbi:unnamed protein product [Linum tenue]|uniref:Uncharacterized protein n=1 Tax=Linum tenue TaxID=586396 RepID=A0AAV0P5B7_9ROSI|nr:unnamed protein product [Linum tenue]